MLCRFETSRILNSIMKLYHVEPEKVILRDYLARDRTLLANERTLLSFVRTSIATVGSAIVCIKVIDEPTIIIFGIILLIISPLILFYGLFRYFAVRKRIVAIPDNYFLIEEDEADI